MKTGYTVADAMTHEPIFVAPKATVQECAKLMREQNVGSILVKDGKKVVGIATERDFVQKVIAEGKSHALSIKDVMCKNLYTATPDMDIFEALMKMRDLDVRRLPVVEKGEFVGLLTFKDIIKIEPQLFDLLADKIEVREAETKPLRVKLESDGSDEIDEIINR